MMKPHVVPCTMIGARSAISGSCMPPTVAVNGTVALSQNSRLEKNTQAMKYHILFGW